MGTDDSCQRGTGGTGWEMVIGLAKELLCIAHGHGQQYGDWLRRGVGEVG